jgi:AAHS family 4-hydroxybenzoate transporter-like MFS transporter
MAGGLMLTLKLDNETIFFLLAIPAVLASLALLAMGRLMRARGNASVIPATLKVSTV